MHGSILANADAIDRSKTDFYPTPKNVTVALLDRLKIPKQYKIWECACGQGHMSKVISSYGYDVFSSDLYNTEYGENGIDFLLNDKKDTDMIITNPPFKLAEEFIRHSIDLQKPFAMLLKSQYWHSAKRRSLFEQFKHVFPLTWRPDFLFGQKSGSPTMECIWTVWDKKSADFTIYEPLKKPEK